jgi:hypothetical protein
VSKNNEPKEIGLEEVFQKQCDNDATCECVNPNGKHHVATGGSPSDSVPVRQRPNETKDDDDAAQELNELSDPESGSFIALMIATAVAVVLLLVCIGGIAIAGIGFAKRKKKLKHDEEEIAMHELDVSEMNLSFQPRRLTIPRGVSMDADMLAAMAIVNGDMEAGKTMRKNPLCGQATVSLAPRAAPELHMHILVT